MSKSFLFVKVGAPNDHGTAFVGWFDDNVVPSFKILVGSPFFFRKIKKFEAFVEIEFLDVHAAFFNKEINRSKLAIRWCPIRLLRFERFEFVSLRFVGRLFFVMKMSFKFDTAKKFFRFPISRVPKEVNLRE